VDRGFHAEVISGTNGFIHSREAKISEPIPAAKRYESRSAHHSAILAWMSEFADFKDSPQANNSFF
jgi:hypothetical protein